MAMHLPEQVNSYLHPDSPITDVRIGLAEASGGSALASAAVELAMTHPVVLDFNVLGVMETGGTASAAVAGAAIAGYGIHRVLRSVREMRGRD